MALYCIIWEYNLAGDLVKYIYTVVIIIMQKLYMGAAISRYLYIHFTNCTCAQYVYKKLCCRYKNVEAGI